MGQKETAGKKNRWKRKAGLLTVCSECFSVPSVHVYRVSKQLTENSFSVLYPFQQLFKQTSLNRVQTFNTWCCKALINLKHDWQAPMARAMHP